LNGSQASTLDTSSFQKLNIELAGEFCDGGESDLPEKPQPLPVDQHHRRKRPGRMIPLELIGN